MCIMDEYFDFEQSCLDELSDKEYDEYMDSLYSCFFSLPSIE